jgi:hypothetical protein
VLSSEMHYDVDAGTCYLPNIIDVLLSKFL